MIIKKTAEKLLENPQHLTKLKRPLFIFTLLYIFILLILPARQIPETDVFHLAPSQTSLEGKVISTPQLRGESYNFIMRVSKAEGLKTKSFVYAKVPASFKPELKETIAIEGYLKEPFSIEVEGSFNWKSYLANKHVYTEIKAQDYRKLKDAPLFYSLTTKLRNSILNLFKESFDSESAAVISGIVLGDRQQISKDLDTAFRDSGAMHLLVASGANVAFIMAFTLILLSLFGLNRNARFAISLFTAFIYIIIAGADAPLVRAYFMAAAAVAGLMLQRHSGSFQGLLIAALAILILEPHSLYEASFQMSFLATFIIIYSGSYLTLPAKWPKFFKAVVQILFITFAVQLVLIPVYTNLFYRFSLMALASNIFLIPLSEVCMLTGFILYFVSLLKIGVLFKIVWAPLWLMLKIFVFLVNAFGTLPFSGFTVPAMSAASIIVFYFSLLLFFAAKKKYFYIPVILLLISPLFSLHNGGDYVYLLNVNKESAAVIKEKGEIILISDSINPDIIHKFLLSKGFRKADISIGQELEFAKKNIIPFKDFWPGDEIKTKHKTFSSEWGVMNSRRGLWINYGYTGTDKDSVSYVFTFKDKKYKTAGYTSFIIDMQNDKLIYPAQNSSKNLLN
ncbi:competence protein ComEC [Parelusimicrobium proximum]